MGTFIILTLKKEVNTYIQKAHKSISLVRRFISVQDLNLHVLLQ